MNQFAFLLFFSFAWFFPVSLFITNISHFPLFVLFFLRFLPFPCFFFVSLFLTLANITSHYSVPPSLSIIVCLAVLTVLLQEPLYPKAVHDDFTPPIYVFPAVSWSRNGTSRLPYYHNCFRLLELPWHLQHINSFIDDGGWLYHGMRLLQTVVSFFPLGAREPSYLFR